MKVDDEIAIKRTPVGNDFVINLKTGIIKDLHTKQLITQKQMEMAIAKLKQGGSAK